MRRISCADTAARIDETQIGFVDERRGLKRVADAFAGHIAMGQEMKLVVHQRHQPIQRLRVALIPGQ
jgi:hypothetical protein